MYIHLLALCWREESLPTDVDQINRCLKGGVVTELVLSCFTVSDGRYRHPRLDQEREKQEEWRRKSAKGGKNSIGKRKTRNKMILEQGASTTVEAARLKGGSTLQSSVFSLQSSDTEPPIVPQRGNGIGNIELFARFWEYYPRRESKAKAFQSFCRLHPTGELVIAMIEWLRKACQSEQWQDRNHVPHASTWLNQRRWEGDPPPLPSANRSYVPDTVGAHDDEGPEDPEWVSQALKAHQEAQAKWDQQRQSGTSGSAKR